MFKLQRLEITGFKSFADYTEIVFTGSGITAVVGPNGCGKSNVSDAISWVLGEQRAKSLRGGEMKDVVFAGTKTRKPGGMAEVVLHLVRDDSVFNIDENELEDIDETLSDIDEASVDMDKIEVLEAVSDQDNGFHNDGEFETEAVETIKALAVGSAQVVETKVRTKRHWRRARQRPVRRYSPRPRCSYVHGQSRPRRHRPDSYRWATLPLSPVCSVRPLLSRLLFSLRHWPS